MGKGANMRGLSRKHVVQGCEASLKRLGVEAIDLYQIHRFDPFAPMEETLSAMDQLVRQGKVRYIGASSGPAWKMAQALALSDAHDWPRFVTMQNHYNLVYREEEREMNPLCEAEGVGLIPWSPLARGLLTGGRKALDDQQSTTRAGSDEFAQHLYDHPGDWKVVETLLEVAGELGHDPAQVALAWLLSKPNVVAPIIGATKMDHLDSAIDAADIELDDETIERLEAAYEPHAVRGH
jgi:aryl-alcohol dehydrogenase-like predicted oxidoreductase